ncbi:MAG TPA: ABC transporter permease [Bryobacteraceae bacterium]|nr:ABC transporter permease [Bryobacteraceae bacterium]
MTLLDDLRYGLRLLRKSPGFAAVAVLTMAVGIAANTTVFSWIDSVLLNPLPGAGDPARVVTLETVAPSGEHITTSYPDYRDIRDHNTLFENVAVTQMRAMNLGEDPDAQRVWGELVSGNYFDTLRVTPALGRFFNGPEKSDAPGAHPVAVLSHALWTSRYHADPSVIGTTVRLNRYPFTIIGVAPKDFHGSMPGLSFDLWAPAMMFGQLTAAGEFYLGDRRTRMFFALARLKPGVSIEQGREELKALGRRMAEANTYTNTGMSMTVVPMWQARYGAQSLLRAPLGILMAVCGVLLLIVCANIANLLLARAMAREKEFSIRVALGARPSRLLRQLLTETLLLAVTGSPAGLLLAAWMRGSLKWMMPAATAPVMLDPALDWSVLAFTEALAVAVAVLAGLAPALHAARPAIQETPKAEGRSSTSGVRSHRLRGVLVVVEVALAVVALVGAGLFVKSFQTARTLNPGFDASHVAIAQFPLSTAGYDRHQAESFCRRLRDRLASAPGVTAVSYADSVPLGFDLGSWEDLQIQGYVPGPSENMKIYRNLVAPGFFDLMRIRLVDGRDFTFHDDARSLPVMIVNQEFVKRFLAGQNPIGRKVQGWGKWFTIVGVVRDSKVHSLAETAQPYFYIPIRQIYRPEYPLTFYARVEGTPEQAIPLMRREARAIDPNVAMFDAMPLEQYISASLFAQKLAATLLGVLGALALLLAAVGLYSVMAYSITERTHEIGIRMALGAEPGAIRRLVIAQGLLFTSIGLIAGGAAAAALARVAGSALIGVSPVDPAVYGGVAVFLTAVAVAAAWIPARRAMRVDPMVSLRYQ